MICAGVASSHGHQVQPLKCLNSSSKQSPVVKVKYARLKLPRMMTIPSEPSSHSNGVKTIVDGTAFSTTHHSYFNSRNQGMLEDYGYEYGYEFPLKAEIFKHARSDKTVKYVAVQPVYYVAALKMLNTDFKAWSSGRIHEYKYYLASYHRSHTCDWRDDISIQQVVFGPKLLSELRILEQ